MLSRFDTPGRFSGSYVIPSRESVRAVLNFLWIVSTSSVISILELGFASDLDIFLLGSVRDMIRLADAAMLVRSVALRLGLKVVDHYRLQALEW